MGGIANGGVAAVRRKGEAFSLCGVASERVPKAAAGKGGFILPELLLIDPLLIQKGVDSRLDLFQTLGLPGALAVVFPDVVDHLV